MRRINIIIIAFLLIAAALIFSRNYFSNDVPSPDFIITMSDTGFSPDLIKISKGTKVIFVNTGKNPHWPASDFHPTHGIYPEFDPLKGILPGAQSSFILKPGKWHYHDHLSPNFTGTIEVGN